MRLLICSLLIGSFLGVLSARKMPIDKLGLHSNYNGIVRDLIKNWESPIVYLRQLGYLPRDYEDTSKIKPNLDALISRMERDDEQQALRHEVVEGDKPKQLLSATPEVEVEKIIKREKCVRKQREAVGNQDTNYPKVDQMMAMKQPGVAQAPPRSSNLQLDLLSHLLGKKQQEQVQPQQKPADILKVLVTKTSPLQGAPAAAKQIESSVMLDDIKNMGLPGQTRDNNPLSIRPNQTKSEMQIEAPHYLNWDIENHKLKQISPSEKNMYVEKLVRIFVQKQESQSTAQP